MDTLSNRVGPSLYADKSRVLLRRMYTSSHEIAQRIVDSVAKQSDEAVDQQLSDMLDQFADRHNDVEGLCLTRFREVRGNLGGTFTFDDKRKKLIGSHFLHEYSIESAALFNPSIVPHFDQSGLTKGSVRFIMSMRATGEGHLSSVTFRSGVVTEGGRVRVDALSPTIREPIPVQSADIDKKRFITEFESSSALTRNFSDESKEVYKGVLEELSGDTFTIQDLLRAGSHQHQARPGKPTEVATQSMVLLAEANYSVGFPKELDMSARVLFPVTPAQCKGIEDARFVLFKEDDGSTKYYATFTAYNGVTALPQMLETDDFSEMRFKTLVGDISNKGMALFPRKVAGKYWMLSRQDDVSVMIMDSDSLYKWESPRMLVGPEEPWEMFKMGNCGSPIETPKGWLALTHGVGNMRVYTIGAVMLDLNDPMKVIGRLKNPLIKANEEEREGYVPNVVYTCGAMVHGDLLVLPYAASDSHSYFSVIRLPELYAAMGLQ